MPWTLAHPAAVLPLLRLSPRWLSFPALVVGSLSPDFGYYVGAHAFAHAAHSGAGLFHSCLPTSIALLSFLFYFREPLCAPLPARHRQLILNALASLSPASLFRVIIICMCVVVGAATHVLWDSFTHEARIGVNLLPFLDVFLFAIAEWQVHGYSVLQHLSTVVGLACLLHCYRQALRSVGGEATDHARDAARRRLLANILLVSVLVGAVIASAWTASASPFLVTKLIVRTAICATSAFVLAYLAACIHAWRSTGDA